ncbi:hypothetical protein EHEL_111930 [Encephalitozoon hellem ATCC 50504]|uniref:Uncharacterized protein n=1 Tax=Encephalitozoon hellem TaxID=27973 RepID=A0A9Q9CC20_ENCHE|nr:uncharacterized protein EHEL_111930 [Encephalitozoon hellem ATCC 50504]AFM99466.1 hypothetical protein EHEL_111930 [Encephalitozoon hellem ATCC 50504]UTX44477.1 hypothetical protein GPU96_11g22810 [Encephalitozoon hellem]|eukprot:XP_003888447.1 hypothetical protein EHEL_111930 [Encephalitozoon hellem ATCC 50504]
MKSFKFKWAFLARVILCSQLMKMFDSEPFDECDPDKFSGMEESELLELLKTQTDNIKTSVHNIMHGVEGGGMSHSSYGTESEELPSDSGVDPNDGYKSVSLDPSDDVKKPLPELADELCCIMGFLLSKELKVQEAREKVVNLMELILKKAIEEASGEDDSNIKSLESSQADALQIMDQIELSGTSALDMYG